MDSRRGMPASAAYWKECAHNQSCPLNERLMFMEQALNHTEGELVELQEKQAALAAADAQGWWPISEIENTDALDGRLVDLWIENGKNPAASHRAPNCWWDRDPFDGLKWRDEGGDVLTVGLPERVTHFRFAPPPPDSEPADAQQDTVRVDMKLLQRIRRYMGLVRSHDIPDHAPIFGDMDEVDALLAAAKAGEE